jgi:hypothetical protein
MILPQKVASTGLTDKNLYRELCKNEPSIPIFSKDWWLDAVCGEDNWDVALVKRGGLISASLPYNKVQKFNQLSLIMPKLTQTLGPWLRPSKAKYAMMLAKQKDLLTELINQLPPFDHFIQNFHYSITNWLPFYWQGFRQTTRYTYVIDRISDTNKVWEDFSKNIRRDIKKSQNRFGVEICDDLGIDAFLDVNKMTFERQGRKLPYTREFVKLLDDACAAHNARRIFFGRDKEGKIHAAEYIIWDENSAYALMGGADPELRNSGATSLLTWEAIKFAASVTKKFDFEGSMIEPIERYFRACGARQVPYFQIIKMSKKYMVLHYGKMAIKRLIKWNKKSDAIGAAL